MNLPKKVAEQGRKADEELKALQRGEGSEPGSGQGEGSPNPNTEGMVPQPPDGSAAPPDGGTPTEPTPGEGGIDWKAEAEALKTENERLTQSLSVLQGKYNSEVQPLAEEVRQLKKRLEEADKGPAPGDTKATTGLTPEREQEIREMYGDDLLDLILSVKAEAKAEAMAELKPKIESIETRSTEDQYATLHQRIAEEVPDWTTIDELKTWAAYLNEIDDSTGRPRREAVMDAYHSFNPGPIIYHLKRFKQRANTNGEALAGQAVPGDAGKTIPQPKGDENTYPREEVHRFYVNAANAVQSGKMSPEEYERLDAIYTQAEIEGRVIG